MLWCKKVRLKSVWLKIALEKDDRRSKESVLAPGLDSNRGRDLCSVVR